jgi:hypothetical protein
VALAMMWVLMMSQEVDKLVDAELAQARAQRLVPKSIVAHQN